MGRPSLYQAEYDKQAKKLGKLGATDKEVADFFGVTEQTINNWKVEFPSFFESLKAGKTQADANVASRLYARAMGYSHPEVHVSNFQGEVTLTPLTKHYPPDSTAAIFWLKNRRPDQWRDRRDVEVTHKRAVTDLSDADLADIASRGSDGTAETPSGPQSPSSLH